MRRTKLLSLAIISLLGVVIATAATRPRYGGVLRVEMRERVNSMDPRGWNPDSADAASSDRLLELVFERLVRLDDTGQPQPALAVSWQHNANFTHWEFPLRAGVKFHDGTLLSPAEAAAALQSEDAERWPAAVSGGALVFNFTVPRPNLLAELSSGRTFIFHPAQDTVFGTGAFRIAEWQPQKRLALIASEDDWAGRPFVDRIEIAMGVAPQQQLVDLDLRKADVIELSPSLSRRVSQSSGARVWASAPSELFALEWNKLKTPENYGQISRALSLAIDRAAIVNVLLQGQGEPAGSLLPQWLSGYAFLFPATPNLDQAKQLRAQFSSAPPLALVYDGEDPMAQTVAERIAVNARDAGIAINVRAESMSAPSGNANLRLARRRFAAPDAQEALAAMLGLGQADTARTPLDTPEQRYTAERAALDEGKIIPVAFVPELYALGTAVRDWMPPRWGGWRLEDVWLDTPSPAATGGAGKGSGNP